MQAREQPQRTRPETRQLSPAIATAAVAAPCASAADPNAVVATVGDHKIREQDLDQKVKPQMEQIRAALEKRVDQLVADRSFDMRRKTLESMTDDYLVEQAAKKENLSVSDYLKKEYAGKNGVTDADAKKFYDQNKELRRRRSTRSKFRLSR